MTEGRRHGKKVCQVSGCNEYHEAKGYCQRHYQRYLRGLDPQRMGVAGCLRRGPSKLQPAHIVLLRLSDDTLVSWKDHLKESEGIDISTTTLALARKGRTYKDVPMDREALEMEAVRLGLEVPG